MWRISARGFTAVVFTLATSAATGCAAQGVTDADPTIGTTLPGDASAADAATADAVSLPPPLAKDAAADAAADATSTATDAAPDAAKDAAATADGAPPDGAPADANAADAKTGGDAASGGIAVLGAPCTKDADCASNECRPVLLGTTSVCVSPCTSQADCGAGSAFFCDPLSAGATSGYCVPRSPAHCLACTKDADCGALSETCVELPGDTAKACHVDCAIAGADACPPDYSCSAVNLGAGGGFRYLCKPNNPATCLDAIGGYCDRISLPQPCSRSNATGACTGSRACLVGPERFDACSAPSPQCKPTCAMQDPAGCSESFCASATSGADNCGACGNACPGFGLATDNVGCNQPACTFSCRGDDYDVDGNPANGCEILDAPSNHQQSTAAFVGDFSCFDDSSQQNITGTIASDARTHENPAEDGFDPNVGAASDWFPIHATGGTFCQDNVALTLQMSGTANPTCYHLDVVTNKATYSCDADGNGTCSISEGSGSYSDDTQIYVRVSKTCGPNVDENATYLVTGHL